MDEPIGDGVRAIAGRGFLGGNGAGDDEAVRGGVGNGVARGAEGEGRAREHGFMQRRDDVCAEVAEVRPASGLRCVAVCSADDETVVDGGEDSWRQLK